MKQLQIDPQKMATALTTPNSTSSTEYQRDDLTAQLVSRYQRAIVFRPEGGGPCEAAAVPVPAERRMLAARAADLHRSMVAAQASDVDRRKIGAAIARMLGGYTVLRNSDTQGLVAGLVRDLWQFPAWATAAVCDKVHDGKYPDIKAEYPPTVPQLCQLIRAEMAPVVVEQQNIASTLALVPRGGDLTTEDMAQRRETAQRWLKRHDPRAQELESAMPAHSDEAKARTADNAQRAFERECKAEGVDPAGGVSPSLLRQIGAR